MKKLIHPKGYDVRQYTCMGNYYYEIFKGEISVCYQVDKKFLIDMGFIEEQEKDDSEEFIKEIRSYIQGLEIQTSVRTLLQIVIMNMMQNYIITKKK